MKKTTEEEMPESPIGEETPKKKLGEDPMDMQQIIEENQNLRQIIEEKSVIENLGERQFRYQMLKILNSMTLQLYDLNKLVKKGVLVLEEESKKD